MFWICKYFSIVNGYNHPQFNWKPPLNSKCKEYVCMLFKLNKI